MIGEINSEEVAAALNELLLYSNKIRLEFPEHVWNILKNHVGFLREQHDLMVEAYVNWDTVTVLIEVKDDDSS